MCISYAYLVREAWSVWIWIDGRAGREGGVSSYQFLMSGSASSLLLMKMGEPEAILYVYTYGYGYG
jgi:hypothetical protein